MWCIVPFAEENNVEVVPKSWYEDGMCKWPSIKGHEKIRRMVERKEQPQSDWLEYRARLMGTKVYDSLRAAREKCVAAEATSDLNSDIEMGRGKRRRIMMTISSDSEEEENNYINKQRVIAPPPSFNEVASGQRKVPTPSSSRAAGECCTSAMTLGVSDEAPRGKRNMSKFEEELLRGMSFIKRTLVGMDERLKAVEDSLKEIRESGHTVSSAASSIEFRDILNCFPLDSVEALDEMERRLMDTSYEAELVNELSLIGGSSAKDFVVRILKTILSDSLAGEFSWFGFKKKRSFSELKLKDVICGAVRRSKWGEETQINITVYVQEWLKHGKFQEERRQKKNVNYQQQMTL